MNHTVRPFWYQQLINNPAVARDFDSYEQQVRVANYRLAYLYYKHSGDEPNMGLVASHLAKALDEQMYPTSAYRVIKNEESTEDEYHPVYPSVEHEDRLLCDRRQKPLDIFKPLNTDDFIGMKKRNIALHLVSNVHDWIVDNYAYSV